MKGKREREGGEGGKGREREREREREGGRGGRKGREGKEGGKGAMFYLPGCSSCSWSSNGLFHRSHWTGLSARSHEPSHGTTGLGNRSGN